MKQERSLIEKNLIRLEDEGYLFLQHRLCRENGSLKLLGEGSSSYVYEAQALGQSKNGFAIKVRSGKSMNRFQTLKENVEWQKKLSKKTPYVAEIIDLLEWEAEDQNQEGWRQQFILMQKLSPIISNGTRKEKQLLRNELTEEKEVLQLAIQIGEAIYQMHRENLLHGDVKPENIGWNPERKVYQLIDFECAREITDPEKGARGYTAGYAAPELENQWKGVNDGHVDMYAFGMMLYILLNDLRFPASQGYYTSYLQKSSDFIIPAPRNASKPFANIIRKMCRYHPEERYRNMEEVLSDLYVFNQFYDNEAELQLWLDM